MYILRALILSATTLLTPTSLWANAIQEQRMEPEQAEPLPKGDVASLEVSPAVVSLKSAREYAQVLVTAKLASGDTVDVTRFAKFRAEGAGAEVTPAGVVTPKSDGKGHLHVEFGGRKADVALEVGGASARPAVDFIRDVNPVMTKAGCNAGTCHGAKDGKAGFKLSLRGYDPLYDVRSLKDDLAGRRLNVASPDDSLMLLKATGAVP